MKDIHYVDAGGVRWHEIFSQSREALKDKQNYYEQKGYKCWLFPYSLTEYVLSVQENEAPLLV